MRLEEWLSIASRKLQSANIDSSRLDCLILLEDAIDKDRSWILANPDYELNSDQVNNLNKSIERRLRNEPLSYIRGRSEFFGNEFLVTSATLQPRPETETMVEMALSIIDTNNIGSIIDLGTGSGSIVISIKLARPVINAFGTEINKDALEVAKKNTQKLSADITLYRGNLLEPLLELIEEWNNSFVIVANLPYVPDDHTINDAAMQEPKIAIFGGEDGLDLYRDMFRQIDKMNDKPDYVLTESLPFQHTSLASIADSHNYMMSETQDLIQVFKAH